MRTAVVGHHEWAIFARVAAMPRSGEIVHASEWYEYPAGGGSAAASQLARLSDKTTFYTAFGDDDLGHRAAHELGAMGLQIAATFRDVATRRAITHIDRDGERTITVMGERLGPLGRDPLPWNELEAVTSVYVTAGDVEAVRMARRAPVLVATARVLPLLQEADVEIDALVASASDASERYRDGDLATRPKVVVLTEGERGGTFRMRGEAERRFEPQPVPGPIVDRYGAGDAFAAGLTYGLGRELPIEDALRVAARCGAAVLTGRGPYEGQLTDVGD